MKKIFKILLLVIMVNGQYSMVNGQTLNVKVGNVIYQFPASQTGDMEYSDGSTLTVMGKTFNLSDISSMTVDNSEVTNNLVSVEYGTSSATVYIAGNVAQYVDADISGAHVSLYQWNTDNLPA